MAIGLVASAAMERALFHVLIVPAVGIAGSWLTDWNWWVFVAIDAGLSVGYEVARVGPAGVSIGIKDVIPVLLLLKVGLPAPSPWGVATSAALVLAVVVGAGAYGLRRRSLPAVHTGRYWRRPGIALAAALTATMVGLFAAGVALMWPQAGPPFAALAVLPWGLAYAFQSPPRRIRSFPTDRIDGSTPSAVLTRVRDKAADIALPVGVRP